MRESAARRAHRAGRRRGGGPGRGGKPRGRHAGARRQRPGGVELERDRAARQRDERGRRRAGLLRRRPAAQPGLRLRPLRAGGHRARPLLPRAPGRGGPARGRLRPGRPGPVRVQAQRRRHARRLRHRRRPAHRGGGERGNRPRVRLDLRVVTPYTTLGPQNYQATANLVTRRGPPLAELSARRRTGSQLPGLERPVHGSLRDVDRAGSARSRPPDGVSKMYENNDKYLFKVGTYE